MDVINCAKLYHNWLMGLDFALAQIMTIPIGFRRHH